MEQQVFYLSDGTGITVETLGNTLLTQFSDVSFIKQHHPYLDSLEKVEHIVTQINSLQAAENKPVLVFSTLVDPISRSMLSKSNAVIFDLFDMFVNPIETHLGLTASRHIGHSHGIGNVDSYRARIDSVHYTLDHDDGARIDNFSTSDIILLGVSRSGKTPTCLYLALNYGIRAANYPLTPDDLQQKDLPDCLREYEKKLFGLSINANRLQQIRQERRPNSQYATLPQCQVEVRNAENLFRKYRIPYLNSSTMSVEEIATHIMQDNKLPRSFK